MRWLHPALWRYPKVEAEPPAKSLPVPAVPADATGHRRDDWSCGTQSDRLSACAACLFRSRGDSVRRRSQHPYAVALWMTTTSVGLFGTCAESDWSELYFSAQSKKYLTADVALMGSLFTRLGASFARPPVGHCAKLGDVSLRSTGAKAQVSACTSRRFVLGPLWLAQTTTYVGRTTRWADRFASSSRPGPSALASAKASARTSTYWGKPRSDADGTPAPASTKLRTWAFGIDTLAQDKRRLKEVQDASMRVVGLDLRLNPFRQLLSGGSIIRVDQAQFMSPVLQSCVHSWGSGLRNYLGTDKE